MEEFEKVIPQIAHEDDPKKIEVLLNGQLDEAFKKLSIKDILDNLK